MKTLLTLILFSCAIYINAQDLQLINQQNNDPVRYAHFEYGDEKGVSDNEGVIHLHFLKGKILTITHVNFGKVSFSSEKVEAALKTGELKMMQIFVSLQPTTVIARNLKKDAALALEVSGTDVMAHDAGAFLSQDAALSGIRKSGSYGFDPVLRGFKTDRLNIVFDDGLSATAACPNRMDPPTSQIPMNMVSEVDILKGPHALRFGNGFGGTIHFKSTPVSYSDQLKAYGRVSGSYEGNGSIYRSEVLAGGKGSFYNVGVFGSYSAGNDYADGNGNKVASAFNRRSVGTNVAFKLNARQDLKISFTNNYATDVDFPALAMDLRKDDTWLMNAKHSMRFSKGNLETLNTSVYGSFVDHAMDNKNKANAINLAAETLANTKNYGARSEAKLLFDNSFLFAGADFRIEQADGTRSRHFLTGPNMGKTAYDNIWQDSEIQKYAAFGEYHFDLSQFFIVASARLELNNAGINNIAPEFETANASTSISQFNPSFSIGATHDLSKRFRLGLWLGRAQRSGSLTERFINFLPVEQDPYERVGNVDLKPEANNQADLSLTYTHAKTVVGINIFGSLITQYITAEINPDLKPKMMNVSGVKQFVNLNEALLTGFEFSWQQQWPLQIYSKVSAAYTYGENRGDNTPLPEIPPLDMRVVLGGKYLKNKIHPQILFRQVLAQDRIAETYGETKSSSFTLLAAKVGYQITPFLTLNAGVDNILDVAYYEHLSRPVQNTTSPIYAPGRNAYASLILKWL